MKGVKGEGEVQCKVMQWKGVREGQRGNRIPEHECRGMSDADQWLGPERGRLISGPHIPPPALIPSPHPPLVLGHPGGVEQLVDALDLRALGLERRLELHRTRPGVGQLGLDAPDRLLGAGLEKNDDVMAHYVKIDGSFTLVRCESNIMEGGCVPGGTPHLFRQTLGFGHPGAL